MGKVRAAKMLHMNGGGRTELGSEAHESRINAGKLRGIPNSGDGIRGGKLDKGYQDPWARQAHIDAMKSAGAGWEGGGGQDWMSLSRSKQKKPRQINRGFVQVDGDKPYKKNTELEAALEQIKAPGMMGVDRSGWVDRAAGAFGEGVSKALNFIGVDLAKYAA